MLSRVRGGLGEGVGGWWRMGWSGRMGWMRWDSRI